MSKENQKEIQFILEFPQGNMLFMKNPDRFSRDEIGGIYFMPRQSTNAFSVWGERRELFGKNAITIKADKERNISNTYAIVYEFGDKGNLTDARLVKDKQTIRGTLAQDWVLRALNEAIAENKITFCTSDDTDPTLVSKISQFMDGRQLVLLSDDAHYIGKDGVYTKVDAYLQVVGGQHMRRFSIGDGGSIEYDYNQVSFNDFPLRIVKVTDTDPASLGIPVPARPTHCDPFTQQPAKPATPKKPGM